MGRRKRDRKNANKQTLCSVCTVSYSSASSYVPRCSSCHASLRHTICDACFHKHILTTISRDISSPVICPEWQCNAKLSNEIIQSALAAYGNQSLWEDYLLKRNWHGTSDQWIKRFSVRCPGCQVPIEKNGGCDRVMCTRCKLAFNWQQAKISNILKLPVLWRVNRFRMGRILYMCLVIILMLLFLSLLYFYGERLILTLNDFILYPTVFVGYILERFILFK